MKYAATSLMICVAALLSLGLVMLFSSSMRNTETASYPVMQAVWCGLGLVAAMVVAAIDYRRLRKFSWVLYTVAIILLALVLVSGIGTKVNGAKRWLTLGRQSFQPSELAKIALIILLANYAERNQRFMRSFGRGLAGPGVFIGLVLVLIFLEPDWGTTLLTVGVCAVMLLVAGVRWPYLLAPAAVGCLALTVLLLNNPVRLKRVESWLDPEATREGVGYQSWQGMVALGAGGTTGRGLGDSRQKYGYLPEHDTDFILGIIGEELGLVGTLGVLLAFVGLVTCGLYIAWHASDMFGLLLATGLSFLIGLQALINIGVVTGTFPNKGLPLPFISRGGSNLFLTLVCVGLLLSVARHAVEPAKKMPAEFDELPVPQTN